MSESRGPLALGITWTFFGIAALATGLRFYTRGHIVNDIRSDDWLILGAVVSLLRHRPIFRCLVATTRLV